MNILFLLIRILGYFLPKRIAELVTRGVSRFCYYFVYREAIRNHLSNLKVAIGHDYSELELKEISKRATYNLAFALYEHTIMDRLNMNNYSKYIKGENLHNLYDAIKERRGVIILSAHLGNYEWGAALMSLLGIPVSIISLEYKSNYIKNIYENNRNKVGIEVFYIHKSFSGPIRFLKKGGVLAIASDRNFGGTTIEVDFFGHKTEIPKGALYLASRLQSPIVPAFSLKEKDGLYHVYYETPYKITKNQIKTGAKKYISLLEKYIKKYPEQWIVFDRIWSKES